MTGLETPFGLAPGILGATVFLTVSFTSDIPSSVGFFTPGIVVLFVLGMFWKKTTANAGLAAAIGSAVFSFTFKIFFPEIPFMDRVGMVFILCIALAVAISLKENKGHHEHAVDLKGINFESSKGYNMSTIAVTLILIGFYTTWW